MRSYAGVSRSTSARTCGAISRGLLCSNGGNGWTSRGQPVAAAIKAAGWASAPQATSATRPDRAASSRGSSGTEGELLDEAVVEVAAVGELDIGHLLQQRRRTRALTDGQQCHLRPLA